MSRSISTFSGSEVYLDTTAIYAFLRVAEPAEQQLFQHIEAGSLQAYTSSSNSYNPVHFIQQC